jgi:hypothetical protein
MTTESANTPSGTGISTDEAAEQFASLLSDESGTQESGETQETEEHEHDEAETPEAEHDPDESETEETEETDESDEQKPQAFELEIDGKKETVTLDELSKGYLRQSDYTRKTTEIANQRQTLAKEVETTQQHRAQYAQALEQANALLAQLKPQEPDWNALYQADPAQYAATREMWRSYQEQQAAIEQQRQNVAQQTHAERVGKAREFVEQQKEQLFKALPAWADPKVASAERAAILEYGKQNGMTEQELNSIADHRAILMMRKAMLFDKAEATRKALKPNGAQPSLKVKPVTPGANATKPSSATEATRAKQRLAKTGRVDDAAAAILNFL